MPKKKPQFPVPISICATRLRTKTEPEPEHSLQLSHGFIALPCQQGHMPDK